MMDNNHHIAGNQHNDCAPDFEWDETFDVSQEDAAESDFNYIDGVFNSPWVGFKNFMFLFQTSDAFVITRNTLLYNIVFIFLGMFLSI